MRLQILGCCGGSTLGKHPTSFLVNDTVAVDAGAITAMLPPHAQEKVDHVVLSHAHLDHVANLPFLVDNRFARQTKPITIYGSKVTIDDLSDGMFNNRVWPDFTVLKNKKSISLTLRPVKAGEPFTIDGLTFTAYPMEHPVACFGFLIDDGTSSIFIAGDTGSTESVKKVVAGVDNLRAIIVEASWPSRMGDLAVATGHLTPRMIRDALPFHPEAKLLVTHVKPFFFHEVVGELMGFALPNTLILDDGMEFDF
ncbi:MAG: 3',5'-cyclic-nucleotide phosphodiesterase [Planctomycetota bacterium JB042]